MVAGMNFIKKTEWIKHCTEGIAFNEKIIADPHWQAYPEIIQQSRGILELYKAEIDLELLGR